MNITNRGPLGQKQGKAPKAKDYIADLHELPCVVCEAFGERQMSPTEAHHVFHDRFGQSKTPDIMAIPLCDGHHQSKRDKTKPSVHLAKAAWREKYGADHSYVAVTQDEMARRFGYKFDEPYGAPYMRQAAKRNG